MYAGQVMEQRPVAAAVRRPAASLHRGAAGGAARARAGRPSARDHPRRRARRVRSAQRLPVRAALRVRDAALDGRAPRAATVAGGPGALPLPAGRPAAAGRDRARRTGADRGRSMSRAGHGRSGSGIRPAARHRGLRVEPARTGGMSVVVERKICARSTRSGAACSASRRSCRPWAASRSPSRPARRWRWSASPAAASPRWRAWSR